MIDIRLTKNRFIAFCLILSVMNVIPLLNQETEEESDNLPKSEMVKSLFFNLGYGGNGAAAALGFRYYRFGISMGVAGLSSSIPAYSPMRPTDKNYEEKRYPAYAVCGDFYFFHDVEQFTLFGNLGYFSQADTVLAFYARTNSNYLLGAVSNDGMTFGAGILFNLNEYLLLGAGLHSKYGIYANFTYKWY